MGKSIVLHNGVRSKVVRLPFVLAALVASLLILAIPAAQAQTAITLTLNEVIHGSIGPTDGIQMYSFRADNNAWLVFLSDSPMSPRLTIVDSQNVPIGMYSSHAAAATAPVHGWSMSEMFAMSKISTDQEAVAAFIAKHGVTRCPAAVAAPTTANISIADATAHAARGIDPVGDLYRAGNGKRSGWARYWEIKRAQRA